MEWIDGERLRTAGAATGTGAAPPRPAAGQPSPPLDPRRLEDLALVEVGAAMMCINLLWGMGACTPLAPAAWRTWRWWR